MHRWSVHLSETPVGNANNAARVSDVADGHCDVKRVARDGTAAFRDETTSAATSRGRRAEKS
jgi:hypothetical protein